MIGDECIIGRNVYIDADVHIGNRVKIQNNALLYRGVTIADGVFIGPRVCLTNDRYPRAITPDGALKGVDDWEQGKISVGYGASIGAGAVVVTDVTIGAFAMVAAGAVVTHDVPAHGLVMGVPARLVGYVCACGRPLVTELVDRWHSGNGHHRGGPNGATNGFSNGVSEHGERSHVAAWICPTCAGESETVNSDG